MRTIPPALQAKLDGGVTTLCRCWLIRRRDGAVQGFTDHDEDLDLDGVACRAGSGLDASEATSRLGLQVDGSEIFGALAHDQLAEADLAAARYDGAAVETWLIDWSEPALRLQLAVGTLGEVRRDGAAFTAELRSPADRLAQESGRLYTRACAADLGDACCRVDLTAPAQRTDARVAAVVATSTLRLAGCDAHADGCFTGGRLAFSTGANAGLAGEVKAHIKDATGVTVTLWQAMPEPVAVDDAVVITAGCDKQFATCRDRFGNAANFRGFPHIPGNDYVIRHA